MKAFVAGATGETGRRIVQALVQRQIPVRALVRDVAAARKILPDTVELVTGDVLQPGTLAAALGDSTVLLCATGAKPSFDPTGPYQVDYEGTKNLVNAAKAKGMEQFVFVSSLCVSRFFHPLNLFWFVLVWKKQAEDYLKNSGLAYTIVLLGGLKNDDNTDAIIMQSPDTLFGGSISRTEVAEVCVEALLHPQARNQIVEVIASPDAPSISFADLFTRVG